MQKYYQNLLMHNWRILWKAGDKTPDPALTDLKSQETQLAKVVIKTSCIKNLLLSLFCTYRWNENHLRTSLSQFYASTINYHFDQKTNSISPI
jgi:hypothetical protein